MNFTCCIFLSSFFLSSFTNNICCVEIVWILALHFCQIISQVVWVCVRQACGKFTEVILLLSRAFVITPVQRMTWAAFVCGKSSWSWRTTPLEGEERRFERKNSYLLQIQRAVILNFSDMSVPVSNLSYSLLLWVKCMSSPVRRVSRQINSLLNEAYLHCSGNLLSWILGLFHS